MEEAEGLAVRAARRRRRWTLKRLGEEAGLHHSFLARIESGQRRLTPETRARIAQALGMGPEDWAVARSGGQEGFAASAADLSELIQAISGLVQLEAGRQRLEERRVEAERARAADIEQTARQRIEQVDAVDAQARLEKSRADYQSQLATRSAMERLSALAASSAQRAAPRRAQDAPVSHAASRPGAAASR